MSIRRIALLACLVAAPAAAERRTIAVTYFDNNTGQAELDPLRKWLADMLITDLAAVETIQVVEREKLNAVLGELKLGKGPFIDPRTAQKLGQGLAAHFLMTGSYSGAGDKLRIDARIVEVATGKVAGGDKVEGKKEELFAIEKELVELLVKTLDLKLGLGEKSRLRRSQTESYEALRSYSLGLDAGDRGDAEKAATHFKAALAADPAYQAAKGALERVQVLSRRESERHGAEFDAAKKTFDPKAPDFGKRVQAAFTAAGMGSDSPGMKRRIELLTMIAEHDLKPMVDYGNGIPFFPEPVHLLALAMSYMQDPDIAERLPAVWEYAFTKYPDDPNSRPLRDQLGLVEMNLRTIRQDRAQAQKSWQAIAQGQASLPTSAGVITERAAAHNLFRLIEKKMKRR